MTYGPALRAGTGPLEMGEEDAQAAATREETSSRTKDEGLSSKWRTIILEMLPYALRAPQYELPE
jgi:hypothetical protein